ncbi:hypothetical protein [Pasteurella oralis]|uniref:hypothetical protein n=1 Tax=Pasteurella oralis TaxID=1071947 RepID=UPI003AF9D6D4
MLKKIMLFWLLLILNACSSLPLLAPLPQQSLANRTFVVTQQQPHNEKSLLVLQFQAQQWRWVQTDPLGAPIARLLLTQQGWQNDGFVMPNKQAQQLFSAIATYFTASQPLFAFSQIEATARGQDYFINSKKVWTLAPRNNGVKIYLVDGSEWLIEELEQ